MKKIFLLVVLMAVFVSNASYAKWVCKEELGNANNLTFPAISDAEYNEKDPASVINWSAVETGNIPAYMSLLECWTDMNSLDGIADNEYEPTLQGLVDELKPLTFAGIRYRAVVKRGKVDYARTIAVIKAVFQTHLNDQPAGYFWHGGEEELKQMANFLSIPIPLALTADVDKKQLPLLPYILRSCKLHDVEGCVKQRSDVMDITLLAMLLRGAIDDVKAMTGASEDCGENQDDNGVVRSTCDVSDEIHDSLKEYAKERSKLSRIYNQRLSFVSTIPEVVRNSIPFKVGDATIALPPLGELNPILMAKLTAKKGEFNNKFSADEFKYLIVLANYWRDLYDDDSTFKEYDKNPIVLTMLDGFKTVLTQAATKVLDNESGDKYPVYVDAEGNALKSVAAAAADVVGGKFAADVYYALVNNLNFIYEEGKLKPMNIEGLELPEDFSAPIPISKRELKKMKKFSSEDWKKFAED